MSNLLQRTAKLKEDKMKLKNGLLGLLLALEGCVAFHGSVDVAYTPKRVGYDFNTEEIKLATEIRGEIPTGKDGLFYMGFIQTLYMSGWDYTQFYETFGGWKNPIIDAYFKYKFREEPIVFNWVEGDTYGITKTYQELKEIGIKIKF